MIRVDVDDVAKIRRSRVCSACWGELVDDHKTYDAKTRTIELRCSTSGCDCPGAISRKTADRREAESSVELAEARRNLRAAAPWAAWAAKKDQDTLCKELGI